MDHHALTPRIDVKAFAKAKTHLNGALPLHQLERLSQDCVGDVSAVVTWAAQGDMRPTATGAEAAWLHLRAQARVPLTCQRCLGEVALSVQVDQDFRFVADEATALAEDDDAQEDLLVISRDFDLVGLVEDELLMALPIVPMHASCVSEGVLTSQAPTDALAEEKPHPFAALASLKLRKE